MSRQNENTIKFIPKPDLQERYLDNLKPIFCTNNCDFIVNCFRVLDKKRGYHIVCPKCKGRGVHLP